MGERYTCFCPSGYTGANCELMQETQILRLSMGALAAILVCLLIILILVLVFVVYNRRREAQIKYPGPDDDVRENIINYEDEGGGEDDMTAFDITPLQIPIGVYRGKRYLIQHQSWDLKRAWRHSSRTTSGEQIWTLARHPSTTCGTMPTREVE